jgi:hypothetical protein
MRIGNLNPKAFKKRAVGKATAKRFGTSSIYPKKIQALKIWIRIAGAYAWKGKQI